MKSTKTKKIRREDIPNLEDGWKSLSSKETGRIGGIISKKSRKNETGNLQ